MSEVPLYILGLWVVGLIAASLQATLFRLAPDIGVECGDSGRKEAEQHTELPAGIL